MSIFQDERVFFRSDRVNFDYVMRDMPFDGHEYLYQTAPIGYGQGMGNSPSLFKAVNATYVGKCFYRIRPNYRTVRLGFSNLQDTLICGQICIYLLRIHYKKRSEKDLLNDDYAIFSDFLYKGICCGYSFELHRLVDAIQTSTHNICLCKEVKKKVHWL